MGQDPVAGREQFPEFRNFSGLAGSGYGVDSKGYPSLSGPTAFSTPVAHVLGHDHFRVLFAKTSFTSSPEFSNKKSDGTLFGTFGHTFGRINVAITDMVLSDTLNQAFNLQAQYIPSADSRLVGSIGIQDLRGGGGSAGNGVAGDDRNSRSYFGVVTYRVDTGRSPNVSDPAEDDDSVRRPLYVSLGIGTRRFHDPFGSVSYQVVKPVRFWAEHDGFGFNEGVTAAWMVGTGKHRVELSTTIGLQKSRYFTWAASLGF